MSLDCYFHTFPGLDQIGAAIRPAARCRGRKISVPHQELIYVNT